MLSFLSYQFILRLPSVMLRVPSTLHLYAVEYTKVLRGSVTNTWTYYAPASHLQSKISENCTFALAHSCSRFQESLRPTPTYIARPQMVPSNAFARLRRRSVGCSECHAPRPPRTEHLLCSYPFQHGGWHPNIAQTMRPWRSVPRSVKTRKLTLFRGQCADETEHEN